MHYAVPAFVNPKGRRTQLRLKDMKPAELVPNPDGRGFSWTESDWELYGPLGYAAQAEAVAELYAKRVHSNTIKSIIGLIIG